MNTVVVSVFSEDGLRATMMAEHVLESRKFEKDWERALRHVKKKFEFDWQVRDVEIVMERYGWRLKEVTAVEVRY